MNNPDWPSYSFHDLLRRLPAGARRKYRALQAAAEDARTLQAVSHERRRKLDDALTAAKYQRRQVDEKDVMRCKALDVEIAGLEADYDATDVVHAKRDGVLANNEQVLARLRDDFIPHLMQEEGPPLRDVSVEARPKKGQTVTEAISGLRSEIASARSDILSIKNMPPAPAEIKEQVRREVQRLLTAGTPRVFVEEGAVRISWPDLPAYGNKGTPMGAPAGSASALMAAMFPDRLFEFLTQGIDRLEGISAADRVAKLADLEAQIRRLEHQEEALVCQAIAAGLDVQRRPYASGWALLAIERTPLSELADDTRVGEAAE